MGERTGIDQKRGGHLKNTIIKSIAVLCCICGIAASSVGCGGEKEVTADLSIWYPGGYEILSDRELNDVEAVVEMENRLGISCDFSGVTGKLDSAFETQMLDLKGVDAVFYRFSAEQLRSSWKNGQILDYTDYLDQMPNLTRLFQEYPLLYQYASVDDKCLFFPAIRENCFHEELLGVRRDWMEQAGVAKIETLEDLKTLFQSEQALFEDGALRGQGDYFVGLSSWNGYIEKLLRVFGTAKGLYWNGDELTFGPSTDEYREYLIWMKELYQANLLDANVYETETRAFERFFLNGTSGAILTTGEHAARLERYSQVNGDDIELEYINPDTLSEKAAVYCPADRDTQVLEFGFVINSEIGEEKLTKLLTVLDYLYSEEGMELFNWGIPGQHSVFLEDGRRVYQPELAKQQESYEAAMASYVKPDMLRTDRTTALNMLDDAPRKAVLEEPELPDCSFDRPRGYYTAQEQEWLEWHEVSISTFVDETSMNFIYKSIDPADDGEWQEYLDTLQSFGAEEYIRIQKAAYERMQQRVFGKM